VFVRPDSDYTRELIDAIPGRNMPPLASSPGLTARLDQ
jgi:hypothetical protein